MSLQEQEEEPVQIKDQEPQEQNEQQQQESPSSSSLIKTALIVLGEALFFQPEDETVLSLTVTNAGEMTPSLLAEFHIPLDSLEVLHIIVKSSGIVRLYNSDAIASYVTFLKAGGELTVHVLGHEGSPSDDDYETIRASLVLAELWIESHGEMADGSKCMTGRKDGGGIDEVVEEEVAEEAAAEVAVEQEAAVVEAE
jgi:hypothetical protein